MHHGISLMCHCEERSDVAISQNPTGQQGSHRRNRNCLPEIATSAYGLLAMTIRGDIPFSRWPVPVVSAAPGPAQ